MSMHMSIRMSVHISAHMSILVSIHTPSVTIHSHHCHLPAPARTCPHLPAPARTCPHLPAPARTWPASELHLVSRSYPNLNRM